MTLCFASTLQRVVPRTAAFSHSACTRRPAQSTRWYASAADDARSAIKSNNVMVFSTTYCPYCAQVKSLFSELNVDHTAWELDVREDGAEIRQFLVEETGQRTVPNVFVGGNHVGGCDGMCHN